MSKLAYDVMATNNSAMGWDVQVKFGKDVFMAIINNFANVPVVKDGSKVPLSILDVLLMQFQDPVESSRMVTTTEKDQQKKT